jgi:hypothetical protein
MLARQQGGGFKHGVRNLLPEGGEACGYEGFLSDNYFFPSLRSVTGIGLPKSILQAAGRLTRQSRER